MDDLRNDPIPATTNNGRRLLLGLVALTLSLACAWADAQTHPLPSWNEGRAKKVITDFVIRVTRQGAPDFVPPAERIATFDNDGTLWCGQPIYVQFAFALEPGERTRAQTSDWKNKQPFKAVLERDLKALTAQGEKGAAQLVAATHTGMSTDEFNRIAANWIASARHSKFKRAYTELVETERQTGRRNRALWHRMGDQFDRQATFLGR